MLEREYDTIVVVGGGCYGSYYVRQLLRAREAGALKWRRVVVVDRDPACLVAGTPGVDVVTAEWGAFFRAYLADGEALDKDAIVPSPLMPHLFFEWIRDRARERWPGRRVTAERFEPTELNVPWQRTGEDGTHYVSFATWMCPVNCIEPAKCPHTKGPRDWSMPVAVESYLAGPGRREGLSGPVIFHCTHRAYGVGMIDTADLLAADATVTAAGTARAARVVVGTVSHCHGALSVLSVD